MSDSRNHVRSSHATKRTSQERTQYKKQDDKGGDPPNNPFRNLRPYPQCYNPILSLLSRFAYFSAHTFNVRQKYFYALTPFSGGHGSSNQSLIFFRACALISDVMLNEIDHIAPASTAASSIYPAPGIISGIASTGTIK